MKNRILLPIILTVLSACASTSKTSTETPVPGITTEQSASPTAAPAMNALPAGTPSTSCPAQLLPPLPAYLSAKPDARWFVDWSSYVETHLPDALQNITYDRIESLCPTYPFLDPTQVWPAIIGADVEAESGYNPSDIYTEDFKNDNGDFVKSEGLLQLSVEDVGSYAGLGSCGLSSATILDPLTSLRCGLQIMASLVASHPTKTFQLAVGGTKTAPIYWSSLEIGSGSCDMRLQLRKTFPACVTPVSDCK